MLIFEARLGTIALAYGVIADVATPAERGSYVGILMALYARHTTLILSGFLIQF